MTTKTQNIKQKTSKNQKSRKNTQNNIACFYVLFVFLYIFISHYI